MLQERGIYAPSYVEIKFHGAPPSTRIVPNILSSLVDEHTGISHCAAACSHRWLWAPDARRARPARRVAGGAAAAAGRGGAVRRRAPRARRPHRARRARRGVRGHRVAGRTSGDVTLPEDDAGAAAAVAGSSTPSTRPACSGPSRLPTTPTLGLAAATEEHTLAALDVHHDPRRLDWSLRGSPHREELAGRHLGPAGQLGGQDRRRSRRRGGHGRKVLVARAEGATHYHTTAARGVRAPGAGPRHVLARRARVRGERGRGAGLGRGPPGGAAGARRLGRGLPQRGRPSAAPSPPPIRSGPRLPRLEALGPRAPLLRRREGARRRDAALIWRRGGRPLQPHSAFNFLHDAKARARTSPGPGARSSSCRSRGR